MIEFFFDACTVAEVSSWTILLVGVEVEEPRMTEPLRAVIAAADIPPGDDIWLLSGQFIDLATFAARCEG